MTRQVYVPKVYQGPGTAHLLEHDRCALWAGMGTGKTSIVLTALDALYLAGETQPTLVVGPLRVARSVWANEVRKWEHLRDLSVVPIIGSEKDRLVAMRQDAPIYTTNYENLESLLEYWGERWPYRTVVLDEATRVKGVRLSFRTSTKGKEFIAGQGTKRAGALARIAHSKIKRIWELTGTPAPNGLVDLWGQIWFLDAGRRLGRNITDFKKRWFVKSEGEYGSHPSEYAEKQIYAALADICLTIEGKDYFDLREPVINNVYVDLPPKARRLYQEMERDMFIQLETHSAEAFNAAAKTQKLLQLACGAVYVDPLAEDDSSPRSKEWKEVHDEKLQALDSIVSELNGAQVLVVYEFRSDLARLRKAFPKARVLDTQQDEDDFKAGKFQVLLLHAASGGHGIDGFQNVCADICFFGHNWNLEQRLQVVERIGPVRQSQAGFDRHITIHNILARDTVDEVVLARIASKRSVQDLLLDAMKRRN